MMPFATCMGGSVNVSVGSRIENLGNDSGLKTGNFPPLWLITPPEFISDPVAGRVTTVPMGSAVFTGTGINPYESSFSGLSS